jgi:hypothetical protein
MRRYRALTLSVCGVLVVWLALLVPAISSASSGSPRSVVRPRAVGGLDCNGLSPIQRPARVGMMCADPRGSDAGRFEENGHYIGHDEPSMRFLSSQPGSGNNVTFRERLPVEPAAAPTVAHPGTDVTHTFELSIAPWYSMEVCDPNSAPLLPCTPRSDANAPNGRYLGGGSAFVELQFYPPGFGPFVDNISCDNQQWCSALTIDSLECVGTGSGTCNANCVEPVNFAFIQTNGIPAGPPSPQTSDLQTYTPDVHTLKMNPGDNITVRMFDAKVPGGHALEVIEQDRTTKQTGWMIASGANGFMNTDPFSCDGTPFNFEPEYSTAGPSEIVPWGIGPYGINSEFEIGHFEPCTSVRGPATLTEGSFKDSYWKRCRGPYEPTADVGSALEPNDAPCFMAGDTHGGTSEPNLVTGCPVFFNAIGDLDYDGTPYYADWPDSVTPDSYPSTFRQAAPTTLYGQPYPQIQFMTDASATEFNTGCDLTSGSGCVLPPEGPGNFYPYWTQAEVRGSCVWEFGNMRNGRTFGGDAQYGSVGPDTIGAFVGPIISDPGCESEK